MLFWIFLTAVLIAVLLLAGRTEPDFARQHRKEARLPLPVFRFGLWAGRYISKYRKPVSEETRMKKALLYDETYEKVQTARRSGIVWCILFAGSLLCLMLAAANESEGQLTEIMRPSFGEENPVNLVVHGLDHEETLTLNVSGRMPDREEVSGVFRETFEQMQPVWLNGNESFEAVRQDLNLPEEADNGVRLYYESRTPEVISSYGIIRAEEIPAEGIRAEISVSMRLHEFESSETLSMRILPEEETALTQKEALQEALRQADEEQIGEKALTLPTEFQNRRLRYETEKTSPFALLFFILLAVAVYPFLMKEKLKEAYRERNEQLELSYPGILAKMSTFLQAGMSIRSAFLRIASDYERKKRENTGTLEYACEEILLTARMIENGMPEKEAYVAFGRRTGLHTYMKFGSLLSENLTQGISGLEHALEEEMNEALEKRKNTALKKGEEAGTKLVFPMVLMLGVVMVVLAVPAFMSF